MKRFKKGHTEDSPAGDESRRWTLRRKMVFLCVLVFLVVTPTLVLAGWFLIFRGYRQLEESQVSEDLERVTDAFLREAENLDLVVRDWAFWDDTYEFAAHPDPAYLESNLDESTFTGLRVQAMLFLDTQGSVVYAKAVDLALEREMAVPRGLLAHLQPDGPFLQCLSSDQGTSGLLVLPEGPFLVCAEPILTSELEGPPRGVLVMARFLDGEEVERITEPYHLQVATRTVEAAAGTPEWEWAGELLLSGERMVIRAEDSSLVKGYAFLHDIYGEPAMLLRVTRDRSLYRQGRRTFIYYTSFTAGFGLILLLASIILLEGSVLRRIDRLGAQVEHIGKENGHVARIQVSGNDEITALARSINRMVELRELEERRFRSLVEHAQDIVVILNADGRVTYQSPSTARILGYSPKGIKGMSIFDLLHPDDLPRARHIFRRAVERPYFLGRHEMRIRRGDGTWSQLEFTGVNLLEDPAVSGLVVNARDITAQVESRERLERINRLFLGLGADAVENIEWIVQSCREILRADFAAYSREESGRLVVISTALGEDGLKIIEPSENCPFARLIRENARATLPPRRVDVRQHCGECPVGTLHGYGLCAAQPVIRGDRTVGFLSVFDALREDLNRDELETLGTLARAISVEEERMAHETALKDFIDIASHELRHPATLMKGYAATLKEHWTRLSEETRREMLEAMDRGTDRLDLLIRELLDVSRIERGRLDLNLQKVSLRSVAERALAEMEARGNRGRFRLNVPAELSPRTADPDKLHRVLIILLENAVNFSPPESLIELSAEERGGLAVFSVLDRGPGVPEKDRERIFERFYRVEDVLHHSKSGMGMGLYIAREIVEAHGGKIWYEPRPGGGSVFRFTLRQR